MLTITLKDAYEARLRPFGGGHPPTYQGSDKVMSLFAAARVLRVDRTTLLAAVRSGTLKCKPRDAGGSYRVSVDALTTWLTTHARFGPRLAEGSDRSMPTRQGKRWTADELVALVHRPPDGRSLMAVRVARCRARKRGIAC